MNDLVVWLAAGFIVGLFLMLLEAHLQWEQKQPWRPYDDDDFEQHLIKKVSK